MTPTTRSTGQSLPLRLRLRTTYATYRHPMETRLCGRARHDVRKAWHQHRINRGELTGDYYSSVEYLSTIEGIFRIDLCRYESLYSNTSLR